MKEYFAFKEEEGVVRLYHQENFDLEKYKGMGSRRDIVEVESFRIEDGVLYVFGKLYVKGLTSQEIADEDYGVQDRPANGKELAEIMETHVIHPDRIYTETSRSIFGRKRTRTYIQRGSYWLKNEGPGEFTLKTSLFKVFGNFKY